MPWARELVIKLAGTVPCSRGEKGLLRNCPGWRCHRKRGNYGCCGPDKGKENPLWSPLGKLCVGCKSEQMSAVLWSWGRKDIECPERMYMQAALGHR